MWAMQVKRLCESCKKRLIGRMCLRTILKMNEKPNSKLGLPRVTIRGQIIPQPKSLGWFKKGK